MHIYVSSFIYWFSFIFLFCIFSLHLCFFLYFYVLCFVFIVLFVSDFVYCALAKNLAGKSTSVVRKITNFVSSGTQHLNSVNHLPGIFVQLCLHHLLL